MIDLNTPFDYPPNLFRRAVLLMQFWIYSFHKSVINGLGNKADSEGFGANSIYAP